MQTMTEVAKGLWPARRSGRYREGEWRLAVHLCGNLCMHNEFSMTSRVCLLSAYLAAAVAGNILASHAAQTTRRGLKGWQWWEGGQKGTGPGSRGQAGEQLRECKNSRRPGFAARLHCN